MKASVGLAALGAIVVVGIGIAAMPGQVSKGQLEQQMFEKTEKGLYKVARAGEPVGETQLATFGAGCFWGIEESFRRTPGVIATASGYSGGNVENPTYKQVCTDTTGHAEVVQVEFDPTKITYEELLNVFFKIHDPTQVNRQGPDFGKQYRSVVLYHNEAQQEAVQKAIEAREERAEFKKEIATQVVAFEKFWPAEEYHQQYIAKGGPAHCPVPIPPR